VIRQAAAGLRAQSEAAAATRILHYLYNRELNSGKFEPTNFLGLAETDLQAGDVAAAMTTLKRMSLVSGQAFETLIPAADVLEKYKRTAEAEEFLQQRVAAVPWDAETRLRLARLRPDVDGLRSIAASTALYQTRAQAAEALETLKSGPGNLTGELALLARGNIQPSEVGQHYYFESRVVAARAASGAQRLQLLLDAFAIHAGNHDLRVEVFRAAAAQRQYRLALAALDNEPIHYGPQFQSPVSATLALEKAAVHESLGEFDLAAQELRQIAANGLTAAERTQIAARLSAVNARRQLEQENRQRMPAVVGQGIEQQKLVRPRRRS
jgi:hypothetical protein